MPVRRKLWSAIVGGSGVLGCYFWSYRAQPDVPAADAEPTHVPNDVEHREPVDGGESPLEYVSFAEGIRHSARFMNQHSHEWITLSSTFHKSLRDENIPVAASAIEKPQFEVLRVNDVQYQPGVPLMRLIAFFPGVSTDRCLEYLTDVKRRMSWDTNYRSFDDLTGEFKEHRIMPPPSRSITCITGASKKRLPFKVVKAQLMTHIVGSSLFLKFGIKPRCFVYERAIARAASDSSPCYSVVFRSLPLRELQVHPAISELTKLTEGAIPVVMYHQEILLLPVFCASDLKRNFSHLEHSGSLYDPSAEITVAGSNRKEELGCLMIMTSMNDAKIPTMPRWIESKLAVFTTGVIFDSLLRALRCPIEPSAKGT